MIILHRTHMKNTVLLLLTLAASPLAGQAAPSVATALPAPERAALEKIRKDVWVHWFSGDTAGLRRVLAPELVAISPDSPDYQSLATTISGSASFKQSGRKLQSVTFTKDSLHRFGDVVVMFSNYTVVASGPQGFTQKGRATEVFVRRNGRWVHTSWHLDVHP
jgi:ketosteroid isomerase-like protein